MSELKLSHDDLKTQVDESLKSDVVDNEWVNKQLAKVYSESYAVSQRNALDKVTERYVFSQYLIDPVKFRFRKVIRIIAIVMLFIKKLKVRTNKTEAISPLETR